MTTLITPASLRGTILRDAQTSVWFARTLTSASASELFNSADNIIHKQRSALIRVMGLEKAVFLAGTIAAIGLTLVQQPLIFPAAVAVITTTILVLCSHFRRETTAFLALHVLHNQKQIPVTLYHFCEELGQKYGCPTLVDLITQWDSVMRYIIGTIYLGAACILFQDFLATTLMLCAGTIVCASGLRYMRLSL